MKLARRCLKWAGRKERLGCGKQAKRADALKVEGKGRGLREGRFKKSWRRLGCKSE